MSYSLERMGVGLDSITKLIKSEIKRQYKSVRQFSEKSGIPYSTLSNALSKGIGGTSYDTVVKICDLLNLKQLYDTEVSLFNKQFYEICTMLTALDEQGVHTVRAILTLEYNRCMSIQNNSVVKGFNGIAFASKKIYGDKNEEIKRLINEVKNHE